MLFCSPPFTSWTSAIGCGRDLRDEKLAPFPRTEHSIQVHRREYYLQLQRCVIADDWKLIVYPTVGVTRLYDLKTDPQEMRDVASDPVNSDRKEKLFKKLQALQVQLGDSLRLKN